MKKHMKLLTIIFLSFIIVVLNGCTSNQEETKGASEKEKTVEVGKRDEITEDSATNGSNSLENEDTTTSLTQNAESNTKQQSGNTSNGDPSKPGNNQPTKENNKKETETSASTTQPPKNEVKIEQTPVTPPVEEKKPENLLSVTTVINGPSDIGTIVGKTTVDVEEGATILDVLLLVAKNKGIIVEYTGKGALAYVEGINNIYEFDYGPKSGWTIQKNGVTLDRSVGAIQVKNGDHIEWIYKEDYTEE